MTENIFGNNIWVAFLVSVIIIISYSNLKQNQQMLLIYLLTFGSAFFRVMRIYSCFILFFVSTYIFIEYLTDDRPKLELVVSIRLKIMDYLFLLFSQFHIFWFFVAMACLFVAHISFGVLFYIALVFSFLTLYCCIHNTATQPFKIKSFSQMIQPFVELPYYLFHWTEEAEKRYQLLCEFEDRTFLKRQKSYSIFSAEYISMSGSKVKIKNLLRSNLRKNGRGTISLIKKIKSGRGYSTPEMQLIRTIGVERGYEKHKYARKLFEIVYSHILFSSLRQYQRDNSGPGLAHFRQYILDVYLKNVLTKINDRRISKLNTIFEKPKDVSVWPMEALFVACLGLSFRPIVDSQIYSYENVISKYNLDINKIRKYARMVDENKSIPCLDEAYSVEVSIV